MKYALIGLAITLIIAIFMFMLQYRNMKIILKNEPEEANKDEYEYEEFE